MFSSYNSVCGAQKAIVSIPHLNEKPWPGGTVALCLAALLHARAGMYPGSHALSFTHSLADPARRLPLQLDPEKLLPRLHKKICPGKSREERGKGDGVHFVLFI